MNVKIRYEVNGDERVVELNGPVGRDIVSVVSPALGSQMVPAIYKFYVGDTTYEFPLNRIIMVEMTKE